MILKSYKDLIVWQKSIELVVLIYELTSKFPKSEQFGIVSQMRRAVVSVSSSIAEGYGRKHIKEYRHFLSISYGSVLELETQLTISKKLGFLTLTESEKCFGLLQEVSKMLNSMINKFYGR